MTARPELALLDVRIGEDLARVEREVAEVARRIERCQAADPDQDALWLLAKGLHGFYTGLEAILEKVHEVFFGEAPRGPDSHTRLLQDAARDVPRVRPPVLRPQTAEKLYDYLRFRHFFRHAYGVSLDWDRMRGKVLGLAVLHEAVREDLARFRRFLQAAVAAPPAEPPPSPPAR
ncbi:MAG: hypothetical protein KatS3mg102_1538 [Planctomycetota bacterium]|nr:MAG: hypothetical protein KatS3mg102_1538 [Planctomycetota bacterium]